MDNNFSLNINNIPKELSLILNLIKDFDGYLNEEQFKNIDWDLFIELAIHHRIYPVLYLKLRNINNDYVPHFVIQALKKQYQRNTFQMLKLTAEMEQVNQSFYNNGIRLLFLKGPVLAKTLYGDISLRTSSDLDLLIPIERLRDAEKVLFKLGYEKEKDIENVLNDWTWRYHHVNYFHPQKGLKLEIHWRMHPGPGKEQRFEELWERKSVSTLTSSPVYFLGNEDLFLFLVSHGARHGWSRLRWLMDIHQLLQLDLDWQKIYQLLKLYSLFHIGGQSIYLSSQFFDSIVKEEVKTVLIKKRSRKLAQDAIFFIERMVNLHTKPVPNDVFHYYNRHLFALKSKQQKILFILSLLYPYPIDLKTLPLPKPLHFLYFPLRPFLWVWRRTRKHALP